MSFYRTTDYSGDGYTVEIYNSENDTWHRSKAFWSPHYQRVLVAFKALAKEAQAAKRLRKYQIVNTGTGKRLDTWTNFYGG